MLWASFSESHLIVKAEKRDYINLLRGTAVFLMLWGHCIQFCTSGQVDFFENPIFKFIYSFHMPLFMIISGYLFFSSAKSRDFYTLISHKAKGMLHPILMCTVFNYFFSSAISSLWDKNWFALLDGPWLGTLNSLWFLWSVLSASISLSIATKLTDRKPLQWLMMILGIGFVALFPCWSMNIYMYPYFVIGYYFGKNEEKYLKYFHPVGFLHLLLFVAFLAHFEKKHYIYTSGIYGPDFIYIDAFRWAIGLFGSVAVMWLLLLLFSFKGIRESKLTRGIEALGRNSLGIYALSVSFLSFWLPKISHALISTLNIAVTFNFVYNWIITPLIASFYAFLLLAMIRVLKQTGLHKVLFGR